MNSWILGIPRVVAISCWSGHRLGGTRIRSVVPGYLWLWLYYYVCTLRCPFGCVLQSRKTVKQGPEYSGFFFRWGGVEKCRSLASNQTSQHVRREALDNQLCQSHEKSSSSSSSRRNVSGCFAWSFSDWTFLFFLQLWLWSKTNTRTPSHNRYFWCPRPKNVDY